ncbi:hypothetical protein PoB_006546100 [Plakobranchus ocellatus]|uniref:Uncharacterized protein n=1 Tax=Plakobranchus ocellatus TaxID=259542 RepID=A0AAV4D4S5_9GAST|nr:hypothetical protein PoB_006546100 [Plakobranchus ocellatus]
MGGVVPYHHVPLPTRRWSCHPHLHLQTGQRTLERTKEHHLEIPADNGYQKAVRRLRRTKRTLPANDDTHCCLWYQHQPGFSYAPLFKHTEASSAICNAFSLISSSHLVSVSRAGKELVYCTLFRAKLMAVACRSSPFVFPQDEGIAPSQLIITLIFRDDKLARITTL